MSQPRAFGMLPAQEAAGKCGAPLAGKAPGYNNTDRSGNAALGGVFKIIGSSAYPNELVWDDIKAFSAGLYRHSSTVIRRV